MLTLLLIRGEASSLPKRVTSSLGADRPTVDTETDTGLVTLVDNGTFEVSSLRKKNLLESNAWKVVKKVLPFLLAFTGAVVFCAFFQTASSLSNNAFEGLPPSRALRRKLNALVIQPFVGCTPVRRARRSWRMSFSVRACFSPIRLPAVRHFVVIKSSERSVVRTGFKFCGVFFATAPVGLKAKRRAFTLVRSNKAALIALSCL